MNLPTDYKTILIVDDDIEITELLSVFVKGLGYKPEVKYDAVSTKEWLLNRRPALILLDIMLPDTTGIEFCLWLNSMEHLKGVPIIHITGFMKDDVARMDSIISGAKDFLVKPIDLKLLEDKIKNLLP